MKPLIIQPKDDITPTVMLDTVNGKFEITGWSHPEDARSFYSPVIDWLNEYSNNPNAETNFHFHFQYYNTASAKQIFRLISLLEDAANKSKTKIFWHHGTEDADMLSAGERFSKMSTVPFEFVPR